MEGGGEVQEGVAGVEEGVAVGAGCQVGGVGALPRLPQLAALLEGQVGIAVVQNEDGRPKKGQFKYRNQI